MRTQKESSWTQNLGTRVNNAPFGCHLSQSTLGFQPVGWQCSDENDPRSILTPSRKNMLKTSEKTSLDKSEVKSKMVFRAYSSKAWTKNEAKCIMGFGRITKIHLNRERKTILVGTKAQKDKGEKRRTTIPLPTISQKDTDSTVAGERKKYLGTAARQRFKSAPQFVVEHCPEGTLKNQGHIIFSFCSTFRC